MIWFTGDWHLNHEGILVSCKRPFVNVEEMNHYILDYVLKNLHKTKDELYILGDLGWNNWQWIKTVLEVCPHKTHVIYGNHDKKFRKRIQNEVAWAGDLKEIKVDKQKIFLSHYAMRVWSSSHWGSWNLYGHSHGKLPPIGKQWDVSLDNNNYEFLTYDQIVDIMRELPHHHYIDPHVGEIVKER
jgi:calcineurin-like phosphoesterase family protein